MHSYTFNSLPFDSGTFDGPGVAAETLAYAITGPAGGLAGFAYAFAVAPDNLVASDTVTLSDGGAGGTFSRASFIFAATSATQYFSYMPPGPGTVTISGTSAGSHVVAPLSYAASDPTTTTDPGLIYAAYSDTTGYIIYISFFENISVTTGGPLIPTTIVADPVFTLNGAVVTPARLGIDGTSYFVHYQLDAPLVATDVLAMSCGSGWAQFGASPIQGTLSAPLAITNNSGQDVESIYVVPPTFKVGFNLLIGAANSNPNQVRANWCSRLTAAWGATVSYDSNGLPAVITGTSTAPSGAAINDEDSNTIDPGGTPGIFGYWTVQYDDATPGVAVGGSEGSQQLTVGMTAFGAKLTAVSTTAGTWNATTQTFQGCTSIFNVQLASSVPTAYSPKLTLTVWSASTAGRSAGQFNVAFQNLTVTAPSPTAPYASFYDAYTGGGTPNGADLGIDQWLLNKYQNAYVIRATAAYDNNFSGDGSTTYPVDIVHPLPTEFEWNLANSGGAQVATIEAVSYPFNVIIDYLSTTLAAAITSTTATSITVADATNIASGTTFLIDSEWMVASGAPTGNVVPVVGGRGQQGTTAATHLIGANVLTAFEFGAMPGGGPTPSPVNNPWFYTSGTTGRAVMLVTTTAPHGFRTGWQVKWGTPPPGVAAPAFNLATTNGASVGASTLAAAITDSYANTTTLTQAITTSTASFTIASGASIADGDVIMIGGELMTVTAGGGTTTISVTRNTPPAVLPAGAVASANGAAIYPATEITMAAASTYFPVGAGLQVDSEQLTVATSGKAATSFWVGRGTNGTAMTTHASGLQVYPAGWATQFSFPYPAYVINTTQFVVIQALAGSVAAIPTLLTTITNSSADYTVTWSQPAAHGLIPVEMAATLAASVASTSPTGECVLWLFIGLMATDAVITEIVGNRVIPYINSGVKLITQCSNEVWDSIFVQYYMASPLAATAPNPTATGPGFGFASANDFIAYRQDHINKVAKAAFTAASLDDSRVYSLHACQFTGQGVGGGGDAESMLIACQKNAYPVDFLASAPYFGEVSNNAVIGTIYTDWVPPVFGGSNALAAPDAATFRGWILGRLRAMYFFSANLAGNVLGLSRWLGQYNRGILVGSSTGTTATANPSVAAGAPARFCCYEMNALAGFLPDATAAWKAMFTATQTAALARDIHYDPAAYWTERTYYAAIQQQACNWARAMSPDLVPVPEDMVTWFGCFFVDVFSFQDLDDYGVDTAYPMYTYAGQKAGYGDGSGGRGPNQNNNVNIMSMVTATPTPTPTPTPGAASSFATPLVFDYANDVPRAQAMIDWNNAMAPGGPVPTGPFVFNSWAFDVAPFDGLSAPGPSPALASAAIVLGGLSAAGTAAPVAEATAAVALATVLAAGTGTFLTTASGAVVLAPIAAVGRTPGTPIPTFSYVFNSAAFNVGTFDGLSAPGPVPSFASAAITLGSLTATGIGGTLDAASAAVTLTTVLATGTGTFATSAAGGIALTAISAAGVATISPVGSGAVTLGGLAAAGIGSFLADASATVTLGSLAAAGSAGTGILGFGTIAMAGLAAAGAGTFATTAAGTIALSPILASGAGTFAAHAAGSLVLTAIAAAGAASFATSASGAPALGGLEAAGTGTFVALVLASGTVVLGGLAPAGTGSFLADASAAVTLGSLAAAGSAGTGILGSGALTLASLTAAGTATLATTAAGPIDLTALAATGRAGTGTLGSAAVDLGAVVASATATFVVDASGAIDLAPISVSAAATATTVAAGAVVLAPIVASAQGTPALIAFMEPAFATLLPDDVVISDIDPNLASILN